MGTRKKLTKKQRTRRKVIIFAIEIVILLLFLAGVFIWQKLSQIDRDEIPKEELKINELNETTKELLKGYTNIAVFGLDNRENGTLETGNSDVIMIASINNDNKEVKLVSVYRDTYLDIGDGVYRKANAAYNREVPRQGCRHVKRKPGSGY